YLVGIGVDDGDVRRIPVIWIPLKSDMIAKRPFHEFVETGADHPARILARGSGIRRPVGRRYILPDVLRHDPELSHDVSDEHSRLEFRGELHRVLIDLAV